MQPAQRLPARVPTRTTTLAQVLATYLCAILLVQGLGAAFAQGAGPLHRHRPGAVAVVTATLFVHRPAAPVAQQLEPQARAESHAELQTHGHLHSTQERHHHAAGDSSVVTDAAAQATAEAARQALVAALSLLALQTPTSQTDHSRHVMVPVVNRPWLSVLPHLLYRPPRAT